ncbi:MAG: amidohydrolase [Chitinophagales bacterium]|nr:amidohydrolase [Chitinophagales bacterium]
MLKEKIKQLSEKHFERVVQLRRQIHANPELSWQEVETSKLVAKTLSDQGLTVQTGIAKHGVVGILKGRNPESKCIALRADMDALPIKEENQTEYCSENKGVMHACGHDVHTANLLGAAMILSELKNEIEGTYKFIFQPSEEKIPSGAEAMIKEGVLQNPRVEKMIGLHVSPELEAGTFGFCSGKFMASSDEIYLTVVGKGGHAAKIEELKNPLLIASEILLNLRHLTNPQIPVVLSFGKIEGKGATNIVPDVVEIAGTLRCFDEALRTSLHKQIEFICESISEKYLSHCEVKILHGYPVLINDEQVAASAKKSAQEYIGAKNVLDIPTRMGSEDFAYYTHHVPACFYRLGVGNKNKGITSGLHTPTFDIDESALKESIGLMSWIAVNG